MRKCSLGASETLCEGRIKGWESFYFLSFFGLNRWGEGRYEYWNTDWGALEKKLERYLNEKGENSENFVYIVSHGRMLRKMFDVCMYIKI